MRQRLIVSSLGPMQLNGRCLLLFLVRASNLPALVLALAILVSLQASAEPAAPPLTVCLDCRSDASFAYYAEQSAPYWAPHDQSVVVYPMYVIESWRGETRFFDVQTWYDLGGVSFDDLPDLSEPAGFFTPMILLGSLRRHAEPAGGDAEVMRDIEAAHEAARGFLGEIFHIDFSGQSWRYQSVMDLIGSEGYSSLQQRSFENILGEHYQTIWEEQSAGLSDRVETIARYLISQSNYIARQSMFRFTFPDGTQVRGDLNDLNATSGSIYADLELSMGSAIFPEGVTSRRVIPKYLTELPAIELSPPPLLGSLIPMLERLGADMRGYFRATSCDPMRFEERADGTVA